MKEKIARFRLIRVWTCLRWATQWLRAAHFELEYRHMARSMCLIHRRKFREFAGILIRWYGVMDFFPLFRHVSSVPWRQDGRKGDPWTPWIRRAVIVKSGQLHNISIVSRKWWMLWMPKPHGPHKIGIGAYAKRGRTMDGTASAHSA